MGVSIPDPGPVVDEAVAQLIIAAPLRNTTITPTPVGGEITVSAPTFTGIGPAYGRSKVYVNGVADSGGQNGGELIIGSDGSWSYVTASRPNGTYSFQPVGGVPFSYTINNPTQPLLDENGLVATMDYNPAEAIFYFNNIPYADSTSFLFALGATNLLTSALQIGPYIPPGAANLVGNGTFDISTQGWSGTTSTNSNLPTLSVINGELQVLPLAASNLPGAYTSATDPEGSAGNAYRYTATCHKGASAGPAVIQTSAIQGNFGTGTTAATAITSTTPTTQSVFYAASPTQSLNIVGLRSSSTSSDANPFFIDNVSVIYVCPYQGWVRGPYTVFLDFTLPIATPSADQIVFQAGVFNDREMVIVHRGADQQLIVDVKSNNLSQTSLNLGVVANSTRCRLTLSLGINQMSGPTMINLNAQQHFTASLNGSIPITSTAGSKVLPGPSHILLKCGIRFINPAYVPVDEFPGTLQRAAILRGQQSMQWCQYQSARHLIGGPVAQSPIVMFGDSYVGGAGGVVFPNMLQAATGRPVINCGKGGITMDEIKSILLARSWARDCTCVFWDGSNNGYGSVATYFSLISSICSFIGHNRIVFLPPVVPGPGNGTVDQGVSDVKAIHSLIAADGRMRTFDPQIALKNAVTTGLSSQDTLDDSSGRVRKDMYLLDGVHLNSTAMGIIVSNTVATLAAGTQI